MPVTARVLTVGETMALLDPLEDGIEGGTTFRLRIAGAESNFAVGLTRLGVRVAWVSRLGADPFGDVVADTLAAEGLDLRYVHRDPERPTGMYFKSRRGRETQVFYYRAGSAACYLSSSDVPDGALEGVELVHLTGITAALSESSRELVLELARRARERRITVLFDPNYRPALWESPGQAAGVLEDVLPSVDWCLCGLEEGNTLVGTASAEELVEAIRRAGARGVVVRLGARGALLTAGSTVVEVPPPAVVDVRDEVGAGDGFAAGFAYGLLRGWDERRCALTGHIVAASALRGTGDWETLPRLEDIRELIEPRPAT